MGLVHSFSMRAKGGADLFKLTFFTMVLGMKILLFSCVPIRVHPESGFFHSLPAPIVQHNGEDR